MTSPVQVLAIVVSSALLLLVLELVRRRRLTEEYSFIWIACAVALLVLSIRRELLDAAGAWLGVYYPPAVLLLVVILFVFVGLLSFSVTISRQRAQIERLIEDVAILEARLRDREQEARPSRGTLTAGSDQGAEPADSTSEGTRRSGGGEPRGT